MLALAALLSIVSLVCGIIILIDAFKNAVWKGIVCLVTCGIYMLYYAIVEFQNDKKWTIVGAWIGCSVLSSVLRIMSMQGAH